MGGPGTDWLLFAVLGEETKVSAEEAKGAVCLLGETGNMEHPLQVV